LDGLDADEFVFLHTDFQFTKEIGVGTGWTKYPFFIFIATSLFGETASWKCFS